MAVRTQVKFYYDVLSPYAWFGFESLCRYQKPWDLDLQLKPMNIWKVMQESGNTGPWRNPSKFSYMNRDTQMVSEMLRVPYKPLANFVEAASVRGSFPTLKTLAACQILYPDHLEELSRQSWLGLYSKDIDITDEANIRQFAQAAQIPDVDRLIEFSLGGEAKQQLVDNTAEAVESKCFGAPWYTVTNLKLGKERSSLDMTELKCWAGLLGKSTWDITLHNELIEQNS